MAIALDLDLTAEDVSRLASADALAAFVQRLGYSTSKRAVIPPDAVGLGECGIQQMELLSEDADGFLRIVFAQLRSVTAKTRGALVRAFGQQTQDYLLILTNDFDALEFVLIEKVQHQRKGPGGETITRPQARVFVVPRRWPQTMLRIVRRLTFTAQDNHGQPDAILQFAKLKSIFDAAHYSGRYFQNRALFADHYLERRLPEDAAWAADPGPAFAQVGQIMRHAREEYGGKDEAAIRQGLFEPLFEALGLTAIPIKASDDPALDPDYRLQADNEPRTVALVYAWERWLDGPDAADPDTPDENPGAAVVTLLERGDADWVIVTNGKLWRLYSRQAHSRSTNFYEVDLEDALLASGQTDPNEAFRYWWLFFRAEAFAPVEAGQKACWLDRVATGSRDYAREVEAELKKRVFYAVVPQLAAGFLEDRRTRLKQRGTPTDAELEEVREATLTLLYRILFLLYAESRDLLPVRESAYYQISFKRMKEEIAEAAGIAETDADQKLAAGYKRNSTELYDRMDKLVAVMDGSDPARNRAVNVPVYNGGLFRIEPEKEDSADPREVAIARFLNEHKVPDLFLASAIDRLARVPDEKTFGLGFVDYKSLGVRQLGSIYEGLLEFRLKIAEEDLPPVTEKGKRKASSLTLARGAKHSADKGVKKGEPYLANDKAERKATGSYYTPDHIVQYIVENTVGPVLQKKLEALRPVFREAEKTYHQWWANAKADPRIMLAWRPPSSAKAADAKPQPARRYTDEHFRAFALDKSYEQHKELVEKLFDLKVLDPAMGSGHFLVEAVDYVTDALLHFLNAFPANPVMAAMQRTRESILASLAEQGIETDQLLERQLTDVHLIKRHVLKRCIYGVDLNPLATELAKVSLWLDAFTIGAPLSFLDHHLRSGNSLIGASVAELDNVLFDQMFKVDYEPLRRAIRDVLLVARSADATAAEAHLSARNYAKARKWLSGYRIVLDVLVAKHFDIRLVERLLMSGIRLDLGSREKFLEGLPPADRKRVAEVEALTEQRKFFHWDLEFPEAFYAPKSGVLDAIAETRASQAIEPKPEGEAGFDALIGNPPYDVLSEKETGQDLSHLQAYLESCRLYRPSIRGKNNYYKLFVCRAVALLRNSAKLGFITPMAILGDDQAAGIREHLRDVGAFTSVDAFPQKDDPERRVFPEAKLSTAVFSFRRITDSAERGRAFISRVHPAQFISTDSPSLRLTMHDISLYDPENLTIVSCSQADWDLATRLMRTGRMTRLREYVDLAQGEVNETNVRKDGHLADGPKSGKLVTRGASICLYVVRPASQGEDLYLDVRSFLAGKGKGTKAFDHKYRRVGWQESCPQNNFRRLIAALIPAGEFCNHKINYLAEPQSKLPLEFALGLLNSKLCDWYFRLGSTNAAVSHYQIYNLPCPIFRDTKADEQAALARAQAAAHNGDLAGCWSTLRPLLDSVPVAAGVRDLVVQLVKRIAEIEAARGEIARTDRSHLAEKAQPYQDLIDRLLYAMAGLTEAESRGLEERLATML